MDMNRMLGGLAVALAAFFAGAALYINIVEQPARLALADVPLLAQWKAAYGVGAMVQAPLALVACLIGLFAWWRTRNWRWAIGAVLMLANWPWTLAVIVPLNSVLLSTAPDAAGPASRALIEQWGPLHAVRTGLGLSATLAFLWAGSRPETHRA